MDSLPQRSIIPRWRDNYDAGWAGFQFTDNEFVSKGICWFEMGEEWPLPIVVSHTFLVIGPDQCIEALNPGVVYSNLLDRFNDPHTHVFFCKPVDYCPLMAEQIIAEARTYLGEKYGFGLVVAKMISRSFLGAPVNEITHGGFNRALCRLLDFRHTSDCDGVVARSLNAAVRLHGLGVLAQPADSLDPELLFEDQTIFVPWSNS